MTKKHFIAIAKIIECRMIMADTKAERDQIKYMTADLASYFKTVNPNFDRDRFFTAALGGN